MAVGGERHGWGRNSSDSYDRGDGGDEFDSGLKYRLYNHQATNIFLLLVQSILQTPKANFVLVNINHVSSASSIFPLTRSCEYNSSLTAGLHIFPHIPHVVSRGESSEGKVLRLEQQYTLCSASLQDIISRFETRVGDPLITLS
ncbi:hypothetical protein ACQ4PT_030455 [Festuca glaucescens]